MSKTYEALKKAEAEREQRTGSAPLSPSVDRPPPLAETDLEDSHSIPASEPSLSASIDNGLKAPQATVGLETRPETNGHTHAHSDLGIRPIPPNLEAQYQRLFSTLVVQNNPQQLKALMIVGANHGDGVTTSASLFARALAKSRTVLLVDANLRTPALAEIFHVRSRGGFADFLARKVTLDGAITPTEEPNLFIMTSGSAALAPPYIFEAGAFDELLTGLKEKFDYIIFDAAPLGLHLDSVFLASRVDGVILVVKAEATQVDVGLMIKKRLEEVGAHFLGVVVNQTQNYIPKALRQLLS
jgi:capsular exopolysaccharide synthesis family protein